MYTLLRQTLQMLKIIPAALKFPIRDAVVNEWVQCTLKSNVVLMLLRPAQSSFQLLSLLSPSA